MTGEPKCCSRKYYPAGIGVLVLMFYLIYSAMNPGPAATKRTHQLRQTSHIRLVTYVPHRTIDRLRDVEICKNSYRREYVKQSL